MSNHNIFYNRELVKCSRARKVFISFIENRIKVQGRENGYVKVIVRIKEYVR